MENASSERAKVRLQYIEKLFNKYDQGGKGFLTYVEGKRFFQYTLDLEYVKKEDREKYKTIVKVADPENSKMIVKQRVLEFFKVGGFLFLDTLSEEQKRLSDEDKDEDLYDEVFEVLSGDD